MPGSRNAHATGFEFRVGTTFFAVPLAWVCRTICDVGGQAEAAAPLAQLVGVVERISTDEGEKVQVA